MERRAPVSRVWRARWRIGGVVEGLGRRAFSWRSCFFAVVRRVAIFCGDGGGVDWSWERVPCRAEVDMVGDSAVVALDIGGWSCCFGSSCFVTEEEDEAVLDVANESSERSAEVRPNLTPRLARTNAIHDILVYWLCGQSGGVTWRYGYAGSVFVFNGRGLVQFFQLRKFDKSEDDLLKQVSLQPWHET